VIDPSPANLEMADAQRLQDLVDREALGEVCGSFFDLFGLPIRVFAQDGSLLADVHQQRSICSYINGLPGGRTACAATVGEVRHITPTGDEIVVHPCFTGAVYRIVPIRYDGRALGRLVVGPYLPSETTEMPRRLLQIDPAVQAERALAYLNEMPRVRAETAESITLHLLSVLDLILFSGHRAYLTSHMHLASVRESFRELAEKTAKLQDAYDELKELDRLKSNFLATISHELRTPLTSIIGYSEMLATGMAGELNEDQNSFVDTIRNKGDQLLELITSLLDMSRFEQGKVEIKRQRLDAAALVKDVVTTSQPTARKKGIELDGVVTGQLPRATGDTARLRQVLQNLTDNAMKFTPAGGKVTIEVRAGEIRPQEDSDGAGAVLMMAPERAVEFIVRDTGVGIPSDEMPRVFDPFYQVDGSVTREHGGTGLGLSIVKRLVEAHGGHIWIESVVGEGTAFHFAIPESDALS